MVRHGGTRPRSGAVVTAAFKNALLIAAATAFGIFLVEAFAFPVLLSTMSANMAGLTQDFARQLAQSSKAGIVPRDYVMLTGDSYAEGLGDALRERGVSLLPAGATDVQGEFAAGDTVELVSTHG